MRTPEQYHDHYPSDFDREVDRHDLEADLLSMTDEELDATFAPDLDDIFAPEDGNTDDIKLLTEQDGRPLDNGCAACGAEESAYEICDDCYADMWDERPTCTICDGYGHGYPGAGPCPLEDRGWDDRDEREMYTYQADM